MYANSALFGTAIFAVFAIAALIGALLAIKRGFFPSLVRLAMIIACALLAFPIATSIAKGLSGVADTLLRSVLKDSMDQIAANSPSTMEFLRQLPLAIITPTLFISLFFLLKWLSLILFRILKLLLPARSSIVFRLLGCVAGALGSVICVLVVLIPTLGAVGLAHQATLALSDANTTGNEKLTQVIENVQKADESVLGPMVNNPAADLLTEEGDSALFRKMTAMELNGEPLDVYNEVTLLSETVADALILAKPINQYSTAQTDSAALLAQDIDQSELLRNVFSEWVASLTGAWHSGESFMNIPEPQVDPLLRPVLRSFYGILATTDEDLIAGDIQAVADVIEVLINYGILEGTAQGPALASLLLEGSVIRDMTNAINAHPRFRPLMDTITGIGLNAISDMLNVSLPDSETLKDISVNLSSALTELQQIPADQQVAVLNEELEKALNTYNVEVPAEVKDMISQTVINEFTDENGAITATEEDVKNYLTDLYSSVGDMGVSLNGVFSAIGQ